jgi:hypothetical protein
MRFRIQKQSPKSYSPISSFQSSPGRLVRPFLLYLFSHLFPATDGFANLQERRK